MATKSLVRQPAQKMIYSNDPNANLTNPSSNDPSVLGLFKCSSNLARSIRQQPSTTVSSAFKSSGALIMNQTARNGSFFGAPSVIKSSRVDFSKTTQCFRPSGKTTAKDLQIRNIIHDYSHIDPNPKSHQILSTLKTEKRMINSDLLDDYEVWKSDYTKVKEEEVKVKVNELRNVLDNTQNEINSKFNMKDEELIPLIQENIDEIVKFYHGVIKERNERIEDASIVIMKILGECFQNVKKKIIELGKKMDLNGYLLEEEIVNVTNDKTQYMTNLNNAKKNLYNKVINEIKIKEKEIVEESAKGLIAFVLRWKNIKLNFYLNGIKGILTSKEFIDNSERYKLMEDLKKSQIMIYEKRKALIFDNLFKLNYEKINRKHIEKIQKESEQIDNEKDQIFTEHIEILSKNSKTIQEKSLIEIENFKANVATISYDFTKDNYNDKKYNDFEELKSLEDLISKELNPILTQNEQDRKKYILDINTYLDEYDGYFIKLSEQLISLFLLLGNLFDDHRNKLTSEERKYLVSIAKACDEDEDFAIQKEEQLKTTFTEMRTCINKVELDSSLQNSFKIIDELEVEYRNFFKILDDIFNSHEGLVTTSFHEYEIKALQVFGIYINDKRDEIQNRRNKESSFLSSKKEAEIAHEEAKKAEEEAKENEKLGKKAKPQKKQDKKPVLKKGEVPPPLVPPREIKTYKSKLGFDYIIDFTIGEFVRHILRNIKYKKDDDIFELKPKTPEELERIQKEKEERERLEQEEKEKSKGKKKDSKAKNKPQSNLPTSPNETSVDFYNAFDPYNADIKIEFTSPLSLNNTKLLSEDNAFNEDNITNRLTALFDLITDKIKFFYKTKLEHDKVSDNEKREEHLSELDIRLKSLSPRKGKIEVEEYDKRLSEIEKHEEKLKNHKDEIQSRNTNDTESNDALLSKIDSNFTKLQTDYEKLSKGIEEEESNKGLEDKFKKFKTLYYDFLSQLQEQESELLNYSEVNPQSLLHSDKNYLLSLLPFSKGGTYSDREIEYTKGELDNIDDNIIKVAMDERKKKNTEKITFIKGKCEEFLLEIQKKYDTANENINAKDGIGKKFGAPKRLINDIIINIKIKCSQAQEGIEKVFKQLTEMIKEFNSIKDINKLNDVLMKNILPINVRKHLSKINTCIFYYGKYIEAFEQSKIQGYELSRVLMRENVESCVIVNKEDIDEDEKLKNEELTTLGLLAKIILEGPPQQSNQTKGKGGNAQANEPNYNNEIASIDDKVKNECAKLYVGNFAKYMNPQEKLPESLIPFIAGIKSEMENMRLKCIRDLRTFSQNLLSYSNNIPQCINKFIYLHSCLINKNSSEKIIQGFNDVRDKSIKIKDKLEQIMGPYLANPYYKENLNSITKEDTERFNEFISCLNKSQFSLIENEEKLSKEFTIRLLNNFESLLKLFDNFIFEEEYVSLGDDEYFKKRENYNELLKLKSVIQEMANTAQQGKNTKVQNIDASNYNLDSKRTFKKVYRGINFKKGKINYYQLFTKTVIEAVENSEEKIKAIEEEYNKDNYSKSITGIKRQNNKNLYKSRNDYYKLHCEQFNKNIKDYITNYNKERYDELEHKKKWDMMFESLKEIMNLGKHEEVVAEPVKTQTQTKERVNTKSSRGKK